MGWLGSHRAGGHLETRCSWIWPLPQAMPHTYIWPFANWLSILDGCEAELTTFGLEIPTFFVCVHFRPYLFSLTFLSSRDRSTASCPWAHVSSTAWELTPSTFLEGTSAMENFQMCGNAQNTRKRASQNRHCGEVANVASWHVFWSLTLNLVMFRGSFFILITFYWEMETYSPQVKKKMWSPNIILRTTL